ncbi:MAG: zinc-binding alcohol dehydrogenase family protein [Candidatus Limnocylindria bacterium]
MRAMLLAQPGPIADRPLAAADRDPLGAGPGELRVAVSACAVCRTDLQLVEGDLAARRLPIVPGHQAVGRVVEVGAGVDGWQAGDRAGVTWLAGSCGTCAYCRDGRENLCASATFTGWDRDGGYAEELVVRADVAVRPPDAFDDESAAPLLCGGVIGHRALRLAGVPGVGEPLDGEPAQGFRLGLFGFGASATLALQEARHLGCRVHVATRSAVERERAVELGASTTGGYHDPPPVPLDAAVTFAPVGSVVVAALAALAPGGTVVVNAIHLDEVPAFPYRLLWEERVLRSVANVTRRDATEFMTVAAAIPIRTSVRAYSLDDANAALADLAGGRIGAGAAVLVTATSPSP